MIKLDRDYSSVGVISAGSGIYVYDNDLAKFVLLVPTSDMPAGAGAPDTIDNPLLTVSKNGQVEGKQSIDQKEYTYNYNRDNNRRLQKYAGSQQKFLERDGMEFTGTQFIGTLSFDKDAFADNEIMNGKIYITVNEDLGYLDDIRGSYAQTAIITSALPSLTLEKTKSASVVIETSTNASVTPKVEAEGENAPTATIADGKLTITAGSETGYFIVALTCSATGEATSERTIMLEVI